MLLITVVTLILCNAGQFLANDILDDIFYDVNRDPKLEAYLREAIENFRVQMRQGIPAIKMPVIDPLELKNLDINVYENVATMSLTIKELKIHSLSSFDIPELTADLEDFYLLMNLTFPELHVNGDYNLEGKIFKIFPIFGNGSFSLNATDVFVSGEEQLEFAKDSLQLNHLRLDLNWKELRLDLENFLTGGSFSEVMQRIIPGVGRDIFLLYKPMILEHLEKFLTDRINAKLVEPDVKDLIHKMFPRNRTQE